MTAATADPGGIGGWVVSVVDGIGEVGVGVLIALENVFPPLPSEVILPFAGFSAARGDIDPVLAWVAATVGAVVGAWVLYAVGALVGYDTLHRLAGKRWFLLLSQGDLRRGRRFFDRHGTKVVLLGRFVPFLRSVVSVPAGLDRMPLPLFTLLTAVGSGIWNAVFLYLGYRLEERWAQVQTWLQPVGTAVVVAVVLGLVVLAVRRARRRTATAAAAAAGPAGPAAAGDAAPDDAAAAA
jgi:membrane protein DedA with SNARE-associated domain